MPLNFNGQRKKISPESEKAKIVIGELVQGLAEIAKLLRPFMPETAAKIQFAIKENKMPETPLFPRK